MGLLRRGIYPELAEGLLAMTCIELNELMNMLAKLKPPQIFLIFLALFSGYFFYFFHDIGNVNFFFWDESLYANAARAYLTSSKPYPVPDHPPFGKEVLAVGLYLFGDNPVGWRFFSVCFGALACTLISYLAYRISERMGVGLFVGALLFLDPLFVVHFRLGLLDPPLTALLLVSTCLAYQCYAGKKLRLWLLIPLTVSLGLAVATKMLALFFIPILWALVVLRLWREPSRFSKIILATLLFTLIPPLVFLGTYLILGYTGRETYQLVKFMFAWHRTAEAYVPLTSRWYEWFYIKNPVWYFVKKVPDQEGMMRGVMGTGNFVLWIGAELGALYALFRKWRKPEVLMIALLVLIQIALYTQKRSTFMHYMTEILPFLYILMGVAIGDLFDRYEDRHKRVLQLDFACFGIGALIVFLNYWPYLWGRSFSQAQLDRISGRQISSSSTTSIPAAPTPHPIPYVLPGDTIKL